MTVCATYASFSLVLLFMATMSFFALFLFVLKGEKSLTSLQSVNYSYAFWIQLTDIAKENRQWNFTLCFSDRVKVELEFGCYGNIYVVLNETRHTVCSDGMTEEAQQRMGEVVCQQLNCGKLLTVSQGSKVQKGLLRQVDCSGQEDSLWECLARYGPG